MSSRQENNLSGDKIWEGHQTTCVSEYYSNLKSEAEQSSLGEALIQYANPMWCWCCIKMQKQILLALGVRLRFGDLFPSRANSKPGKTAIYEIHEKQSLRARFTKTELGSFLFRGQTPPNCSLVLQICILAHSLGKYLKGLIWSFSAVIKDGGILSSCAKKNILGRHCLGDIVF